MYKNIFWIFAVFLMVGCKKERKERYVAHEDQEVTETIILPELQQFKGEAKDEVSKWKAYMELSRAISEFREEKGGDVYLQLDDLLEKEIAVTKSDFPEKFDNPAVRSRLAVVRTYLQQTRMEAPDPVPQKYLMEQKVKILNAFNALQKQLTVMVKGSVTDEFLEELSNKPIAKRDSLQKDSIKADSIPVKE